MTGGDGISIRSYRQADAPALSRIYAFHVVDGIASFEQSPPDDQSIHMRMASVLAQGLPVLVALIEGSVVGYAYAAPYRPREAYRWSLESSVYVDNNQHGKGIGRLLMLALIADVKRAGFQQMIAVVTAAQDDNPSLLFHRAIGFVESGRLMRVGFKHGRWLDTVMMQLTLNSDVQPHEPLKVPPRP